MLDEIQKRRVYHVSPFRYLWLWILFGPIAVFLLLVAPRFRISADRTAMLSFSALLFIAICLITWLIRLARLEVSEKGVCLKKIGIRLEAPWPAIESLRLDPGHESFITTQAMEGKGAEKLAAAAKDPGQLFVVYDDAQLALLDSHRLLPMEAFAWHLRHGKLRAQVECFAPRFQSDFAAFDASQPPPSLGETLRRLRGPRLHPWKTPKGLGGIIALLLAIPAGLLIAMSSAGTRILIMGSMAAFFQGIFAYSVGGAARSFFQHGHRWFGVGMGIFSLLLGLWSFSTVFTIAERFGLGDSLVNACVVAIFAALTWGAAHGARAAFRRHRWFIGALLALCSIFLGFCVITTGIDAISKGAGSPAHQAH